MKVSPRHNQRIIAKSRSESLINLIDLQYAKMSIFSWCRFIIPGVLPCPNSLKERANVLHASTLLQAPKSHADNSTKIFTISAHTPDHCMLLLTRRWWLSYVRRYMLLPASVPTEPKFHISNDGSFGLSQYQLVLPVKQNKYDSFLVTSQGRLGLINPSWQACRQNQPKR